MNVPIVDGDNYYGIYQAKVNVDIKVLLQDLPMAFRDMYEYITSMNDLDPIKYDYIYGK